MKSKANAIASGLAFGVFWAIGIAGMTIISALTNTPGDGEYTGYAGSLIKILTTVYPGYGISCPGLFYGIFWALVDGFVSAAVLVAFYNFFNGLLTSKRSN